MISRRALFAVAVLGLLGSGTNAHAGWYRILGNGPRPQETNEGFTRHEVKYVKRTKAPLKTFDEKAMKRIEAENHRSTKISPSHKYEALVARGSPAPEHFVASKPFGSTRVPSISERLGGSHGAQLEAMNEGHVIKRNANLFLKKTNLFSPWANQWKGNSNNNGRRMFSFVN